MKKAEFLVVGEAREAIICPLAPPRSGGLVSFWTSVNLPKCKGRRHNLKSLLVVLIIELNAVLKALED